MRMSIKARLGLVVLLFAKRDTRISGVIGEMAGSLQAQTDPFRV